MEEVGGNNVSLPAQRRERGVVSRRLVNVTLDNLDDLPSQCRRCVFWELDPVHRARAETAGGTAAEKETWVSTLLLGWGSCGKILYVDGTVAGHVLFGPPAYVPRSSAFASSPPSPDAVVLTSVSIRPEFAAVGLGRMLIQGVAKDMRTRGIRAIEAFGDLQWKAGGCMLPAEYLLAVGFKTIRSHHRYPRLRLELKDAVSWREDVEFALERLLGMGQEGALRPA